MLLSDVREIHGR